MPLFTYDTIKRIQEENMRRSLSNHRPRTRQDRVTSADEDLEAVVIELDLAGLEETTQPIGA